jgi:hypothetical protein
LCAVLVFGTTLLTKHTILPRTRNPFFLLVANIDLSD